MGSFRVDSEIGQLRKVLLHCPDLELARLTPANIADMLFDEIMWADRARIEHQAFADVLRSRGVEVFLLADLLATALADEGGRKELLDRVVTVDGFGAGLAPELRAWFDSLDAAELVTYLIGGVIPEDLPFTPEGLVGASFHPTAFVLPPLPNQLFMRDTSAWMYGGVSINPMAFPSRRRETMHLETVYRRHPMFAGADFPVWYGGDGIDHYPAVVEGGDILVIGRRALLVGMGERTTHQGVEALARRLFDAGVLDTLVAVELPKVRAYMHLDTVLTQVDHDAFVVYPDPHLRDRRQRDAGRPRAVGRRQQRARRRSRGGGRLRAQRRHQPAAARRRGRGPDHPRLRARPGPWRPPLHELPPGARPGRLSSLTRCG
jgi:arginine deiminase